MNIVIPMAGEGKRFKEAGYKQPKPLIEVKGKTLLQWSVDSLPLSMAKKLVFVILKEHDKLFNITKKIKELYYEYEPQFILLDEKTRGQAETVLKAKSVLNMNEALLIFNIDTYFYSSTLKKKLRESQNGVLGAFKAESPNYSFAKLDDEGYVIEVAEKQPISENALTGLYHFSKAIDFTEDAEKAIERDERIKGEFYVAPLYNYLIDKGKKFVLDFCEEHYILGTPDEVKEFEKN